MNPGNTPPNEIVTTRFDGTWAGLPLDPGRRAVAAIGVADQTQALAAAWQHHRDGGLETLITSAALLDERFRSDLAARGFTLEAGRPTPARNSRPAVPGRLWLTTSGSTGRPKLAAHTLGSLLPMRRDRPPHRWLLAHPPGSYAWWQLVSMSLLLPGQHLVAVEPDALPHWPLDAEHAGVDAVTGTPSFWRNALLRHRPVLERLPLRQVNLGGEPVDQAILDTLGEVFPDASVVWAYGSTETGIALTVSDGRAGFPADWLTRPRPGRPELRVESGELLVRSPFAAHGLTGFVHTGDRAEVRGDRVHLIGRLRDDEINVGGTKVSASAVRRELLTHPDVLWARVRAQPAPLVGALVAADVVTVPGHPLDERELTVWCTRRLPRHAVPRLWRALDAVPMRASLKEDAVQEADGT